MPSSTGAPLRRVTVAIAGYGGIGRQIARLLDARSARYAALYQAEVRLVAVCGSRGGLFAPGGIGDREAPLEAGRTGADFLGEVAPDVLFETGPTDFATGGPALGYLTAQLGAGRAAVAVSKGALVHSGPALRQLAADRG
ncbi:hypothetical protein MTR62_19020, partial [Novosphingobium sp. 1949]|nr:hypothetical protein [Novosphingobium organovorum]